jgi:pectate lyase
VQARIKPLAFNGTDRPISLLGRVQDTSNFYFVRMSNSNTIEIRKKISGSTTTLASKSFTVATGTWYTVKLVMNGSALSCYVNDTLQLSATDTSLSSGKIGFNMVSCSAEIDDVIVDDASSSTTSTTSATSATATSTTVPTATPVTSTSVATPTNTPTQTPTTSVSAGQPNFNPVGFCNNGTTVTGGAAGQTVYVSSAAELETYSDVETPYTIYITGSFALDGMSTHIRSNKTVIGVGNVTLSGGGLYLYKASNVIIRNLTITGSTEDNVGIHYSNNIWIDHCTFSDSSDGNIDITQASDYITISWCKFFYTVDNGHNFVNLIASSDSDNGSQYHVTFHHNWWGQLCQERMPSVRFGRAHVYNNYYNATGNNYCVRTRIEAECRVENNFFENVQNPWEQYVTGSGTQGKLYAANNNVSYGDTTNGVTWTGNLTGSDGTSRVMLPGTDSVFAAPYTYSLDSASNVKSIVTNYAGATKGPFAN